jgi:hypothetical protein
MRAEELAAEFGIAGVLAFVETEHGLVKTAIFLDGVAGELYLQGAQVTAWQPRGKRSVLFTSPNSAFAPGGRSAAASRSSSRGSAPVGRCRWRRTTASRAPPRGISTEWFDPFQTLDGPRRGDSRRERPVRPAVLKARIAFLTFTPFNSLSSDASDIRMTDS